MKQEIISCPFCGSQPELVLQPDPDKGNFWTIRCCRIDDFDAWNDSKENLIKNWNKRAHKKNVQEFIDYLDLNANLVSNLKKPRTDNNFGRAAQLFEDALKYYNENCKGFLE